MKKLQKLSEVKVGKLEKEEMKTLKGGLAKPWDTSGFGGVNIDVYDPVYGWWMF
jgi:natural product precursor